MSDWKSWHVCPWHGASSLGFLFAESSSLPLVATWLVTWFEAAALATSSTMPEGLCFHHQNPPSGNPMYNTDLVHARSAGSNAFVKAGKVWHGAGGFYATLGVDPLCHSSAPLGPASSVPQQPTVKHEAAADSVPGALAALMWLHLVWMKFLLLAIGGAEVQNC